jgi:hypothetical protein
MLRLISANSRTLEQFLFGGADCNSAISITAMKYAPNLECVRGH